MQRDTHSFKSIIQALKGKTSCRLGQEELPQVPWAKLEGRKYFSRSEAYMSGSMHPRVFYLFNERISGVAKLIWKRN